MIESPAAEALPSLIKGLRMPRERHQNGWVKITGKEVKKWVGHWRPYRADGTRGHSTVILGLKSKLAKWEAEDKLRQHIAREAQQQAKHPSGEPTFQWFWENSYLPSRTWGDSMRATLLSAFKLHVLPKFGQQKLSELDKLALQQHINSMAASYSRSMVKNILMQYRAMLEEAVEQDVITKNPARKLIMPPTRKPCGRFLSLEEYDALIAQLGLRDRLIVHMFCGMGFRPGELFALRWSDIEETRVRIDESVSRWGIKEPKTQGSDAYVAMPAGIRAEMDLWCGMQGVRLPAAFVFPTSTGSTISPHNYERDVIIPASIRAGIMAKPGKYRQKGDPKRDKSTAVNFQAFRRTFATWMQKSKNATVKDVQGAMRHSTPDQTIKVYMREIPGSVRAAVDDLDRLLSEKRGLADAKSGGAVQ